MFIDMDDEILQDFLVEAGEILEQLNEQLLDLEQTPDDYDLLNAVFRGFHTIKGGAGFLGIEPLVEVCHRAEDVFNVLRQGQRQVDVQLMDKVLQVLDVVNEMFSLVQSGEEPVPADAELLAVLKVLSVSDQGGEEAETVSEPEPEPPQTVMEERSGDRVTAIPEEGDAITEDEFEALLDALHGPGKHSGAPNQPTADMAAGENGEITENEFEALLDDLHGKCRHGGVPQGGEVTTGSAGAQDKPIVADSGKCAAAPAAEDKPVADAVPPKRGSAEKGKAREAGKGKERTPAPVAETTVRVDTARLDEIMNMVGELVLVRNRLSNLKARMSDEEVATAVSNLDVVTADLQNAVMKTRMQPLKKIFGRFPRVVRDLARSLKKEIDLEMHGEDTDLDKNLVEALSDPMVHLVRNAVDHGIETPEERERAGKPRRGRVVLSAAQEGDHILISISDDGKGMDPGVLRRLAVKRGMMDQEAAARLDDRGCYNLIFQPGFSTKSEISDVSGRGVGMDVVKTRIAQINGTVEIDSELGKGSRITIKLPLTLAILPTLMVVLGKQPFALPLASVVEIFNLDLNRTNMVDGQLTIMVRERALPLFYLRQWLVRTAAQVGESEMGHVVVVNVGNIQVGLVVDYLVGQEEVVIKPLGAMLQGLDGMAGATITGDGKIALILDIAGLMRKYVRRH
jgi:two-component system chemotaxis sensor kinase CheA